MIVDYSSPYTEWTLSYVMLGSRILSLETNKKGKNFIWRPVVYGILTHHVLSLQGIKCLGLINFSTIATLPPTDSHWYQ